MLLSRHSTVLMYVNKDYWAIPIQIIMYNELRMCNIACPMTGKWTTNPNLH